MGARLGELIWRVGAADIRGYIEQVQHEGFRMRTTLMAMGMAGMLFMCGRCVGEGADASATTERAVTSKAPAVAPPGHPYARQPASPAAIMRMTADEARTELMVGLAGGDQKHVEQLLEALVAKFPDDQGLWFFLAVCTRSRFEVRAAFPMFEAVKAFDPTTPEGQAAALMIKVDRREETDKSLAALFDVVNAHHEDLLIQWAAAIACRTLDHDKEGCQIYRYILGTFDPAIGPPLMHQTFANLLDNTGEYQEALIHRNIVVRMEPAGWSYQGLANTLDALKEYDKADAAYAKAISMAPNDSLFWQTWGSCLRHAGRQDKAQEKFARAVELNPHNQIALDEWGRSLEIEQNLDQALDKYRRAVEAAPKDAWMYDDAVRVLKKLGRSDEADELREEARRAGLALSE
jgi:tetratricopeptide (TPR) repeat protein